MPKIKAGGADHVVKKNKKGEIIVDHAASAKAGKYDKINLTKKAGVKTVKEGVKATKDWHKVASQKHGEEIRQKAEKRIKDKRGKVSGAKNNNSRESRAKRAEAKEGK